METVTQPPKNHILNLSESFCYFQLALILIWWVCESSRATDDRHSRDDDNKCDGDDADDDDDDEDMQVQGLDPHQTGGVVNLE